MAIYAKKAKQTEFELPPEGVPLDAELVEIEDLGEVAFGSKPPKPRVKFFYSFTSLMDKKGFPIRIWEFFHNTLHEKGKMPPRIFSLTGKMPDPEDENFDLESLVGIKVQIVARHKTKEDGTTYPEIVSLVRRSTEAAKKKPGRNGS